MNRDRRRRRRAAAAPDQRRERGACIAPGCAPLGEQPGEHRDPVIERRQVVEFENRGVDHPAQHSIMPPWSPERRNARTPARTAGAPRADWTAPRQAASAFSRRASRRAPRPEAAPATRRGFRFAPARASRPQRLRRQAGDLRPVAALRKQRYGVLHLSGGGEQRRGAAQVRRRAPRAGPGRRGSEGNRAAADAAGIRGPPRRRPR